MNRLLRKVSVSSALVVVIFLVSNDTGAVPLTGVNKKVAVEKNHNALREILQKNKNIKTILFWNLHQTYKNKANFGPVFSNISGCPMENCVFFDKKNGDTDLTLDLFDAIVFNIFKPLDKEAIKILHRLRHSNQMYVFVLLESPVHHKLNLRPYNNVFNWSMTYRRDSDIYYPYGWIASKNYTSNNVTMTPSKIPLDWRTPSYDGMEIPRPWTLAKKTKAVAWFVTHCVEPSNRSLYAKELAKFIKVDVYGKCGTLRCSRNSEHKCYEMLEENYFFYLSFENSLCKDYVTEKFFSVLNYNVVPVVYGGADYDKIAPPMSYINVKDYSSPKELAKYLNYLAKTPEEYRKYFWWKTHYQVVPYNLTTMFCNLCKMLKSKEPLGSRIIKDIDSWWNGSENCKSPLHFSDNQKEINKGKKKTVQAKKL